MQAVYGAGAPTWLQAADLHSTRPVASAGAIRKGYAGNVLIRRSAIEQRGLRFDLALGRSGGEDDDFFYRLTDTGGVIGFAPDALAYEPVPAERTTLRWLLRRGFRTGQSHGARLISIRRGPARLAQLGLAAAKALVCLAVALSRLASRAGPQSLARSGSLHAGVVARLAGLGELQLY